MMKPREIISNVGKKRFVIFMLFLAVTGALAGAWQKYYLPKHNDVLAEEAGVESERRRLQGDILELPKKYDEQKANIVRYEALQARGFFSQQDRIEARARIDKIRAEAGLRGVNYNIDPQEVLPVTEFPTMTDNLISSHITVEMKGLTDLEMRNFILKMNEQFGGLLNTRALELELGQKMDEATLMQLSQKQPVDFINGKVEFDWYGILPKPADATTPQAQAFGGQL